MGQKILRLIRATAKWAFGNLLWSGVTVAWTFGGSAVVTAVVGVLLTTFSEISDPFLVLLLIGIFFLAMAGIGTMVQPLAVGRDAPKHAADELGTGTDNVAVQKNGNKAPVFDPHTIITILAGADLSGLSEPESFMMITLNVRNVSAYPVTITGVKGRIRCAGAECNSPATVEREPRSLGSSDSPTPCTIRQALGEGMMQRVVQAGDLLRISLSGLQWVGTVALPQGSVPLERCYIHEEFLVRGLFREKKDASTLFRVPTTFLSSEYFDSDGLPKPGN